MNAYTDRYCCAPEQSPDPPETPRVADDAVTVTCEECCRILGLMGEFYELLGGRWLCPGCSPHVKWRASQATGTTERWWILRGENPKTPAMAALRPNQGGDATELVRVHNDAIGHLADDIDTLKADKAKLAARVEELEAENAKLKANRQVVYVERGGPCV